jgi:hypothetical protein
VAAGSTCPDTFGGMGGFVGGADAAGGAGGSADAGVPGAGVCGANGGCGSCGAMGQVCCGGTFSPPWCSASNTTCVFDGVGGFGCKACGGRDQPCCSSGFFGPMGGFGSCNAPLTCNFNGQIPVCGDMPPISTPVFPGVPSPVPVPSPPPVPIP